MIPGLIQWVKHSWVGGGWGGGLAAAALIGPQPWKLQYAGGQVEKKKKKKKKNLKELKFHVHNDAHYSVICLIKMDGVLALAQ